jgi:hypothetical protein
MAFTHTKKVDTESFIKARIRNRIRIRPKRSGSDRIRIRNTASNSIIPCRLTERMKFNVLEIQENFENYIDKKDTTLSVLILIDTPILLQCSAAYVAVDKMYGTGTFSIFKGAMTLYLDRRQSNFH